MRFNPGFIDELIKEFKSLDKKTRKSFEKNELSFKKLCILTQNPTLDRPSTVSNVEDGDTLTWTFDRFEKHIASGLSALNDGSVAVCLLAGGEEPSYQQPVDELGGISLLALRLMHCIDAKHVWIMSTPTMSTFIDKHMIGISMANKERVKIIQQQEMPALTPMNTLSYRYAGVPNTLGCGTGDAAQAIIESPSYEDFVANGGKYIVFLHMNNLAAKLEPSIIGYHIEKCFDATSIVTNRLPGDCENTLCWADGMKVFIEPQRLPEGHVFDEEQEYFINTGTLIINAEQLKNTHMIDWRYLRTRIESNNTMKICYRRNNAQWLENLTKTSYINMPRNACFKKLA